MAVHQQPVRRRGLREREGLLHVDGERSGLRQPDQLQPGGVADGGAVVRTGRNAKHLDAGPKSAG